MRKGKVHTVLRICQLLLCGFAETYLVRRIGAAGRISVGDCQEDTEACSSNFPWCPPQQRARRDRVTVIPCTKYPWPSRKPQYPSLLSLQKRLRFNGATAGFRTIGRLWRRSGGKHRG